MLIPFNISSIGTRELAAVKVAIDNCFLSGDGPFCKSAEKKLSALHNGSRALTVPSCSAALEMAIRLLDAKPGQEVIVPSWTFVTTVSPVVANGLVPIFADIDDETLGLSSETVKDLVSENTAGIIAVHYGGFPADPDRLRLLADKAGIIFIEDNAHGLANRPTPLANPLGTYGAMSTLSFHETKNISCGEGGALVVNDPKLVARAEIIREKGTDRSAFLRGETDKYTWRDLGSSWVLSDVQAAVLDIQLDRLDEIQGKRQRVWESYYQELSNWAEDNKVQLPSVRRKSSAHNFFLIFSNTRTVGRFIAHMKKVGVQVIRHYEALHSSPFARDTLRIRATLPVTERIAAGLVRLPLYAGLTQYQIAQVVKGVQSFRVGG